MPNDVTNIMDKPPETAEQKRIRRLTELSKDSTDSIFHLLELQSSTERGNQ